eukprot:COSAG05_NODE_11745_length_498_cov_73237.360902_1_plen_66_part_01
MVGAVSFKRWEPIATSTVSSELKPVPIAMARVFIDFLSITVPKILKPSPYLSTHASRSVLTHLWVR